MTQENPHGVPWSAMLAYEHATINWRTGTIHHHSDRRRLRKCAS